MISAEKKLSYYTIFSDEISEGNKNRIIFSTRTSRAVVVNEDVYNDLLNERFSNFSEAIVEGLIRDSILVDRDERELENIIAENKAAIGGDDVFYQVVQPSAMCQLGCDYCGQDHQKVNLKHDLIDKMVSRYSLKLAAKPGFYKQIFMAWFGGEPLMALNEIRIMTYKLKELAKKMNIGYGAKIVTNGLSLKPAVFRELVLDHHVSSFEITLDGIADFHDQRRHTKEGHSTFDIIFKNLNDIFSMPDYASLNCRVSIRCNVDKRNYLGVSPLIQKMAAYNFHHFVSHFYVAAVYSWGNDAHLKSFSKEEFAAMEIDWLIEQYEYGFKPGFLPSRVKSVCLVVSPENEMVDAYGNIFNCTEVSYVDVYKDTPYVLGNLKFDGPGLKYDRPLSDWNDEIMANKYQCHSCKMLPVCGGGCPKSWHEDMRACPTNKFNIKDKLLLAYISSRASIKDLANEDAISIL
jgi:uncharacterized protein